MTLDFDAAPNAARFQRYLRSNRRTRVRRTRRPRTAPKLTTRKQTLFSGGKARDEALNPIVAELKAELIRLAEKYGTVKEATKQDKKKEFTAAALAALHRAYAQSWAAGFQQSGLDVLDPAAAAAAGITPDLLSDPSAVDPADLEAAGIDPTDMGDALGDGEGDVTDAVDNQSGFVDNLAGLLIAGGLTAAAIGAAMGLYAASANPVYEQGFESGVGLQGDILQVTWRTQEDDTVCEMCDERDGQTWTGDEEHPYPGEGYFGEVCEGGPNCRCALEYELIPAAESDTPDAGADTTDTTDQTDTGEDVAAFATADLSKMTVRQLFAYRALLSEMHTFTPDELLALRELAVKYSDDQPRVDAGSPDGGQWTSGGGGGGGESARDYLRSTGYVRSEGDKQVGHRVRGKPVMRWQTNDGKTHKEPPAGKQSRPVDACRDCHRVVHYTSSDGNWHHDIIRLGKGTAGLYIDLSSWSSEALLRLHGEVLRKDASAFYNTPASEKGYNPDQPRDEHGRWSSDGGAESDRAEFRVRFAAAFPPGGRFSAYVTHYTAEEMRAGNMTPLLRNNGQTGLLIHDHGDGRVEATALFNQSSVPGAGRALLAEAVKDHGVNYVECFGPVLNGFYESLGFHDSGGPYPFDPTQAPSGWNYEADDHPDYHTMRVSGG